MANKHKGEVEIDLNGKKLALVYDWEAIETLVDQFGQDGMTDELRKPTPKKLSAFLLAGFKALHPEVTEQEIRKASPPVWPTVKTINSALSIAYFGPDGPPTDKAEAASEEKKTS